MRTLTYRLTGSRSFDRDIDTSLGFGHSIVGTIQDENGIGTGFTHRWPGTGSALAEQDSNIDIDLMTGQMLLTSTRSDIQHDSQPAHPRESRTASRRHRN